MLLLLSLSTDTQPAEVGDSEESLPHPTPGSDPSPLKDGLEPVSWTRVASTNARRSHPGKRGQIRHAALQSHRGQQQTRRGSTSRRAADVDAGCLLTFVKDTALLGPEVKGQVHEYLRSFCQFSKYTFQAGDAKFMLLVERHIVSLERDN